MTNIESIWSTGGISTELAKEGVHGADIASASTLNLETATGELVDVTGTTTITAITLSEGHIRIVRFTGSLVITAGASLILPNAGSSITTNAGDYAIFAGYAAGVVRCVSYTRLTGRTLAGMGTQLASGVNITGGSINNVDIGTGTPNTIEATTIGAANPVNIRGYRPIITESTTARTLALTDSGCYIRTTNGSATTITVPANATVAFSIGSEIDVFEAGAGQVTFAAAVGVTINYDTGLKISATLKGATLKKVGTNEWDLVGSLAV